MEWERAKGKVDVPEVEDVGRAWPRRGNSRVKRCNGRQTETLIKYERAGKEGRIKTAAKYDGHEIFPDPREHRVFIPLRRLVQR